MVLAGGLELEPCSRLLCHGLEMGERDGRLSLIRCSTSYMHHGRCAELCRQPQISVSEPENSSVTLCRHVLAEGCEKGKGLQQSPVDVHS